MSRSCLSPPSSRHDRVDLPDGPGSSLVRGLAACLSSVTETPLVDLPDVGDASVEHAIGAWKSWLAGRDSGLSSSPSRARSSGAVGWIAVADSQAEQVAVLAFGTPPGVVVNPQDPTVLGRATADLALGGARAVASLHPVLQPPQPGSALTDVRRVAGRRPAGGGAMQRVRALAGRGSKGNRYAAGAGTFSPRAAHEPC